MQLNVNTPKKSLNRAFLKEKVSRADIERFKQQLISLFDKTDTTYSEDTLKDFVTEFLRKTWYDPYYAITINTKRKDLSIHSGKSPNDSVAVITEVKKIGSPEMLSESKINVKAFHELVLYYLRERDSGNISIKNLVATDVYQWFIFDANEFDKKIYTPRIKKLFDIHKSDEKNNPFFYEELKKILGESIDTISCTYFNIQKFQRKIRDNNKDNDIDLIPIFKILSPQNLLKLPFANDSNSLDRGFYDELLYLIGLEERKDGKKRIIDRIIEVNRCSGSLLENAITKLKSKDSIDDVSNPSRFGNNQESQYYNIALELCITWVNRIVFLKLLEAQLYAFHKSEEYLFLNSKFLEDYDDLNSLFFEILAETNESRQPHLKEKFSRIPYLNSSLFERTKLERETIEISAFNNKQAIPVFKDTVLKDNKGKKLTGTLPALEYLLKFLDAYDFTSEGKAEIQEQNKRLINAAVLGLIFEKINGYKDGSYFTPGFVTMYMCRKALEKAVVQKFNEVKGWSLANYSELYDKIDDRKEANKIINSVTICDPAVGSGHFLVSALNELLAIKAELKILEDRNGRRLKEYYVEVANDELVIIDEDGEPFQYKPGHPESQRVQETLFHEKELLIENCLFGVDINPNSVKICRLRLWIELLKHSYYTKQSNYRYLETLPNIDINIKEGNTLISRFPLDADISEVLSKTAWNIDDYKRTVEEYKDTNDKREKRRLEELIYSIKNDFTSHLSFRDKLAKDYVKRRAEVVKLGSEINRKKEWKEEIPKKLLNQFAQAEKKEKELKNKIDEINNNKIFEQAFEWRFEFPEVMDREGNFLGFDVVIGNPPYIRHERIAPMKPFLQSRFETYAGTADLFIYFVERGLEITKMQGQFIYILPSKWMKSGYGEPLRVWIKQFNQISIIDFGDLPVFEEATTYPCIWQIEKKTAVNQYIFSSTVTSLNLPDGLESYVNETKFDVSINGLSKDGWSLMNSEQEKLVEKLTANSFTLGKVVSNKLFRGVLTGFNTAFVINERQKNDLIEKDARSAEIIKPFLAGKDISRYAKPVSNKFLIFTKRGVDISNYPAVLEHLLPYQEKLQPKPKDWNDENWPGRKEGNYKWYEIQDAVDYFEQFENPKILYQEIAAYSTFSFDSTGLYINNKLFFIPTDNKNILGLLNSKLCWFWLKKKANILRGALALQSPYILSIPIKQSVLNSNELNVLVNQILDLKATNENNDTSDLERQIDELIYDLYELDGNQKLLIENIVNP